MSKRTERLEKYMVRGAWFVLLVCIVGWPLSALTFAKSEPPAILGLSWSAMIVTALVLLLEVYIKKDQ